jgi:hypothetical protein
MTTSSWRSPLRRPVGTPNFASSCACSAVSACSMQASASQRHVAGGLQGRGEAVQVAPDDAQHMALLGSDAAAPRVLPRQRRGGGQLVGQRHLVQGSLQGAALHELRQQPGSAAQGFGGKARAGQHRRAAGVPARVLERRFQGLARRRRRASRMRSQASAWRRSRQPRGQVTRIRCHGGSLGDGRRDPQYFLDRGLPARHAPAPLTRSACMPSPIATSRSLAVLMRVMISSCTAGEFTSTS